MLLRSKDKIQGSSDLKIKIKVQYVNKIFMRQAIHYHVGWEYVISLNSQALINNPNLGCEESIW